MKQVVDESNFKEEGVEEIQRSTLNLLKIFDSVCRHEKIPYYIMGGTLLGAVRHKGFIPWDDDADVALFREDYRRLEKVLIERPPDGTYWESVSNPTHCPSNHFFGKLCLCQTNIVDRNAVKGEAAHHFGIDVFPLDVRPKSCWQCQRQRFMSYYYNHLCPLLFGGTSRSHALIKSLMRKVLSPFYGSVTEIADRFQKISELGDANKSKYRVSLCGRYSYGQESFLAEWFSQSVPLEFEDAVFPAPKGWREILNKSYGTNWMVPKRDHDCHRHYLVK